MKYTKKTSITKKNIKKALINLLANHKFDLITINQIVEEAEITRSTFYRYYDDKYELLSDIEEEILKHIHEERQKLEEKFPLEASFSVEMFKHLFESLEAYADSIYYLLSHNGDASFEMKLRNELSKRFSNVVNLKNISSTRADLLQEYMYVILIKTLQYWSANKDKVSVEEIASTLRDVQFKGFINTLDLNE